MLAHAAYESAKAAADAAQRPAETYRTPNLANAVRSRARRREYQRLLPAAVAAQRAKVRSLEAEYREMLRSRGEAVDAEVVGEDGGDEEEDEELEFGNEADEDEDGYEGEVDCGFGEGPPGDDGGYGGDGAGYVVGGVSSEEAGRHHESTGSPTPNIGSTGSYVRPRRHEGVLYGV